MKEKTKVRTRETCSKRSDRRNNTNSSNNYNNSNIDISSSCNKGGNK